MKSLYYLQVSYSLCALISFASCAADWNYNAGKVSSGAITIKNAGGTPITINANSGGINSLSTIPLIITEGAASYSFDQGVKLTNGKVYVHESNLNVWTEYLFSDFSAKFSFSEQSIYKMSKTGRYATSSISASMDTTCANKIYKASHPSFECTLSFTYSSPGGAATPYVLTDTESDKRTILYTTGFGLPLYVINGVTFYPGYSFAVYSGIIQSLWNCYSTAVMTVDLGFKGVWPNTSFTSSFANGYTYQSPPSISCSEERHQVYHIATQPITRWFDAWVHYVKINTKEIWLGGETFARIFAGTLPDGTVNSISNIAYGLLQSKFNSADYEYYAAENGHIFELKTDTGIVSRFDVATMNTAQVIDLETGVSLASFLSNIELK